MKRDGGLYERIWLHDNLKLAFKKAARGKRTQASIRHFEGDLILNLMDIRDRVKNRTFEFGRFHSFHIRDPKPRVINACPFEERVLHHAIMNICHHRFDRKLIFDTFACRIGKGRQSALSRAQEHCRKSRSFLKLDIARYFDSINHTVLKQLLDRAFKESKLKQLWGDIIDSFNWKVGKGLPIGTLASQYFANFYLDGLDRFVKEELRCRYYIRYMDDFALWHNDPQVLKTWTRNIESYVSEFRFVSLNPKRILGTVSDGLPFLGLKIYPNFMSLLRKGRKRYRTKMVEYERSFLSGSLSALELQRRAMALHAANSFGDDFAWRKRFWKTRGEIEV